MKIRKWNFLLLFLLSGVAADKNADVPSSVELSIVGPDARPLVNTTVLLTRPDPENVTSKIPPLRVITDNHGVARYSVPAGVWTTDVSVPGVGYGNVGLTEYLPGQITKPQLPPLVRYGTISGTIPLRLLTHGAEIMAAQTYAQDDEAPLVTHPDAQGHFKILNARAGLWWVWAGTSNNDRCADSARQYSLAPGQVLENVTLKPLPVKESTQSQSITLAPLLGKGQTVVWVRGRVMSDSGAPIPKATVYGLTTYFGGDEMYEETVRATTDGGGYYELKGPGGQREFNAVILASVPGRPLVWDWPSFLQQRQEWIDAKIQRKPPPPLPPTTDDLVVPSHGRELNVTILRDGKPIRGAFVAVYLENANLHDIWTDGGGPDRTAMEDMAHPILATDSLGVAHFENLCPGRYDLFASEGERSSVRFLAVPPGFRQNVKVACAVCRGIAVGADQVTNLKMATYPLPSRTPFKLLDPNSIPLQGDVAFSYGSGSAVEWNTATKLDASGMGEMNFNGPGLWHIEAAYRQIPVQYIPIEPPFFACIGTAAVSPSLANNYHPSLTARHIEPASVHVVVKDAVGRPLQVPVEIDRPLGLAIASGKTDQTGQIVFKGLSNGFGYIARAFVPGMQPVDFGGDEDPIPTKQLKNRTEVVADSFIAVQDVQNQIILKPQCIAYVVGKIQAQGTDPNTLNLNVYVDQSVAESGVSIRLRKSTGEFVAGPFRPGAVRLHIECQDDKLKYPNVYISTRVRSGEVKNLSVSLFPLSMPVASPSESVLIGISGALSLSGGTELLQGKVLLCDGKTPAWGAQVFYFEPGQSGPTITGMVDALGNIRPRRLWRNMNAVPPGTILGPSSSTIVALLPGQCGGVITLIPAALGNSLRMILPPPLSISGRVTIGNASLSNRNGSIQVLAAYQDKEGLNDVLSVRTTTDANGNFLLAGLTPGTYKIQAALDNIWLSQTITRRIIDSNPTPITLDVGLPGAPVLVRLRNSAGKPAIGESITIDLPPGPLTAALWPDQWTSDGAGLICIPTLEAGRTGLRAIHSRRPVNIDVPPLPSTRPAEVSIDME